MLPISSSEATRDPAVGDRAELASLELMLYPKSTLVIANAALTLAGLIEIVPPEAPWPSSSGALLAYCRSG